MRRWENLFANMLTIAFLAVLLFVLPFVACMAGCGYGKAACTVIDAAHEACAVIRFLGPDGKEHAVRVSRQELEGLAREAEARQAAGPDAGAP